MNSAYSEFRGLSRNASDLLRLSRGSVVLYSPSRIMIKKEMLNISSRVISSG